MHPGPDQATPAVSASADPRATRAAASQTVWIKNKSETDYGTHHGGIYYLIPAGESAPIHVDVAVHLLDWQHDGKFVVAEDPAGLLQTRNIATKKPQWRVEQEAQEKRERAESAKATKQEGS